MRRNIDFYKSIPSSKDDMYVSLEEPQHQKYYKAAANAYDTEVPDFKAVKENILTAIDEYYKWGINTLKVFQLFLIRPVPLYIEIKRTNHKTVYPRSNGFQATNHWNNSWNNIPT